MNIIQTALEGVLIIEPKVFSDNRGFFFESFQSKRYSGFGMLDRFVQDNISHSTKHVLRGLHYQKKHPQGKLVSVLYGAVKDVVVDIRKHSKTFGKAISVELNDNNHLQLYIPPGFAHGFCVLSETAGFMYKCTDYYYPEYETGIHWNDPSLSIEWGVSDPILSQKDDKLPLLCHIPEDELFA